MTPDERQLITGLFDRLRQTGLPEKDREAEQLIQNQLRQMPDSAYMLVQSVIVQEMAIEQTQRRVEELEDQVRQLQQARPQQGSGGFLGGLFGGGQSRPAASAPAMGRQSPGFNQGGGAPMRGGPWGQQAGPHGHQAPPPAGGSFMRTAMATAAGVAGGMLVANAISGMMGGGSANAATTGGAGADQGNADSGYANQSDGMSQDAMDPGNFDAGGGGDWGGGGSDE